jgi:hypothetical protein
MELQVVGIGVLGFMTILLATSMAQHLEHAQMGTRVDPSATPAKIVKLWDVPTPKDTQGPYGMKMCLSPDGMQLAITGNIVGPPTVWNPGEFIWAGTLPPEGQALERLFQKKIYTAQNSSALSDFRLLVDDQRMCVVIAMAISSSKPYQLAYVMRETEFELPDNVGHAVSHDEQLELDHFFQKQKPKGLREVLYVVPLSGGTPKAILALKDGTKNDQLYQRLNVASLCWTDDSSALNYCDGESVSHVSLTGKKDVLYNFEENRFAASYLALQPGNQITFIDYFYARPPDGGGPKVFKPPWLVTIDQDGKVVEKREWPEFAFGSLLPHEWLSLAIIGKDKWPFMDTQSDERQGRLCVLSRSDPKKMETYIIDSKAEKEPVEYVVYAFSPNESVVWLGQFANFSEAGDR